MVFPRPFKFLKSIVFSGLTIGEILALSSGPLLPVEAKRGSLDVRIGPYFLLVIVIPKFLNSCSSFSYLASEPRRTFESYVFIPPTSAAEDESSSKLMAPFSSS